MVTSKAFKYFELFFGATTSQLSLGISISRHSVALDLGFIWVSVEF